VGELDGGVEAWRGEGRAVEQTPLVGADEVHGQVLDVRQASEWAAGHLPEATHIELADVSSSTLPPGPVTVVCGHGERAMTGASILQATGHSQVAVLQGGSADVAAERGIALDQE
jgi:rhodanese-related sulfurtransferase